MLVLVKISQCRISHINSTAGVIMEAQGMWHLHGRSSWLIQHSQHKKLLYGFCAKEKVNVNCFKVVGLHMVGR